MDKLNMQTTNIVDENIKRIGELFPNCLTERLNNEGKPEIAIDFDQLRQELSKDIVEGNEERYQFTWPDKRNAILLANAPTTDTLRPCREESVDFDNTQNLYIEGDNLQVLKLLRENYLGKVKMIYIDPPYNTGNDFVYNDDFSQSTDEYVHNSGQTDEEGNRLVANTESNGRFHTDWLNMIYPRLKVAKDLLSEDGVIFISIDDNEQDNLKKICNEILGASNFVTTLHVEMSATQGMKVKAARNGNIVKNAEYILIYSKDGHKDIAKTLLFDFRPEYDSHYTKYLTDDFKVLDLIDVYNQKHPSNIIDNVVSAYATQPLFKKFVENNLSRIFRYDKTTGFNSNDFELGKVVNVKRDNREYTLERKRNGVDQLMFLSASYGTCDNFKKSFGLRKIRGDWWKEFYLDMGNVSKEGDIVFSNGKKPVRLIYQIAKMCTDYTDIILDFFSGSATTAHAVMQLNSEDGGKRKFIMVQLPEATDEKSEAYKAGYKNICEIGKERIRRAGKKIKEEHPEAKDLDTGFRVLKLDSSNMQDVYYTPENFTGGELFDNNIKGDRTDEDLLFQSMIELGISLSAKIEKTEIAGKTVWSVEDNYLLACFDEDVNETTITEIAKQKPYYFIMRDSSLANDNVADNFEQIFKHYSKDTIRRIL